MVNKIAIVTLYDNINIGNKLQNYALQELLKAYSKEVETLTYSEAREITPLIGWKGRIVLKTGFPKEIAEKKRAIIKRFNRFNEFSIQYINICTEKHFFEYNESINNEYDFFVTGSDQVWHNYSGKIEELDYFMLKFANANKRICYAPSFGIERIPEQLKEDYIKGLEGFRKLSCREIQGCRMINKIIGREAVLLPDPTLCIKESEWAKIELKPQYFIPEHYIIVYYLGERDKKINQQIEQFASRYNLPIIDIFSLDNIQYYVTRPDEFLFLVHRADYVITNSFHGCIFSIIYNKKIKFFERLDSEGKKMNSRFSTLFRIFEIKEDSNGLLVLPSDTKVILEGLRTKAEEYLSDSFLSEE